MRLQFCGSLLLEQLAGKVDGVLGKRMDYVISRRKYLINFRGQYRKCLRAYSFQKISTKQQRPLAVLSPFSLEGKRRSLSDWVRVFLQAKWSKRSITICLILVLFFLLLSCLFEHCQKKNGIKVTNRINKKLSRKYRFEAFNFSSKTY